MDKSPDAFRTISEVADDLDLPQHVLRFWETRFPQIKRLEDFRFADNPKVPQATIAALAEGSWIDDRESVILIGDSGTGKTHLATALAVCACHHGRRVRFTTLAGLANELLAFLKHELDPVTDKALQAIHLVIAVLSRTNTWIDRSGDRHAFCACSVRRAESGARYA